MSDVNDRDSDWPLAYTCTDCGAPFGATTPCDGPRLCVDCATGRTPPERIRRCLGCGVEHSRFVAGKPLCDECEDRLKARRERVLRGVDLRAVADYRRRMEERHGRDADAA